MFFARLLHDNVIFYGDFDMSKKIRSKKNEEKDKQPSTKLLKAVVMFVLVVQLDMSFSLDLTLKVMFI